MNASVFSSNPYERIPAPHWLVDFLRTVPDPRVDRTKKHALPDLLTAAVCSLLCGYSSPYDMEDFCRVHLDWLRNYCPFAGGVPSHDTFRRVLGLVSPLHFGNVFAIWSELAAAAASGQIAIDGKALRRALDAGGRIPYEALEAVRAHWGVETLHWVLDVVMDEDHSRTRTGHAPENLAILRRLTVNILRRERDSGPPGRPPRRYRALRLAAACDESFLEHLLAPAPSPETACA